MKLETLNAQSKVLGRALWTTVLILAAVYSAPFARAQGRAQNSLGGHIGFVLPLVTRSAGETTTLADNFTIAFPVGITFKGPGRMVYDLELVSSVQNSPRKVSLTVHPGVVWSVGHGFGAGVRAAFDVNSSQLGFTPLLNKSWRFHNETGFFKAYFVEADLPVRFNRPIGGPDTNPVTFAMHFGLGF
jgi:hypothetical protein